MKKETKNNLSKEELQSDPFLQALIYSKFEDNFIIVKKPFVDNFGITLLWFFATSVAELISIVWRYDSDF